MARRLNISVTVPELRINKLQQHNSLSTTALPVRNGHQNVEHLSIHSLFLITELYFHNLVHFLTYYQLLIIHYCVVNTATLHSGKLKEKVPASAVMVDVSVLTTSCPMVELENGLAALKTTNCAFDAELLLNEMEIGTSCVEL